MELKIGLLVRAGADDASLRFRAACLRQAGILSVIGVRTPRVSRISPVGRASLPGRVLGKARGLYAQLNFPPRFYGLDALVSATEEAYLPECPPIVSYPGYREYDVPGVNTQETRDLIIRNEIDVLVPSTGIIKPILLHSAPLGCLNAHYGWLPLVRGMWSAAHAIIENRPDWLGVTVHLMDAGIDTGPILRRERPEFSMHDTHETLWVRMHLLAGRLLIEQVRAMEITPVCVEKNDSTRGVYRSRLTYTDHLKLHWKERAFFKRYGRENCPPLRQSLCPADSAEARKFATEH